MGTTPGATENRSRKKMASSREIAASPYWTLTAISLQPPKSNCLFTSRERSCWKVMFSEAFLCPRGGLCGRGGICPGGVSLSRGSVSWRPP